MIVSWQPEAIDNLDEIVAYIAGDDLAAALRLGNQIIDSVDQNLSQNPKLGRPGRVEGTRELVVHRNYIVAYQFRSDVIAILAVRHAARMWPESF